MTMPVNFQFSQGSLQDYVDCPRRFQLKYIEQLAWPALEIEPALENEKHLQQGADFHLLIQQYYLGVPIKKLTSIAQQNADLINWWENFLSSTKHLEEILNSPKNKLYPEITLSVPFGEFRIIGKYDLLSITDGNFFIYDWKTSRKQPKNEWIASKLQTRVYPYLLIKSGTYLNNGMPIKASQINMVYWYANFPKSPLSFRYNNKQYNKDQNYLESLIQEIISLDHSPATLTNNEKRCQFCVYRSLCNRGTAAGSVEELDLDNENIVDEFDYELDFEQIAEIEY